MLPTTINANIPDSLKRAAEGTLDENVHKKTKTDTSSQKVDEYIKNIDLSFLYPSKCTLSLDLNKIEPQTNKTYKTLIEEQSAAQASYTISLVNDEQHDNFYDLDAKSSLTELQGYGTHPVTKNKIRSIYLFTIGSITEEFKYLGVVLKRETVNLKTNQQFLQAVNKAISGDPEGFYELALHKLKLTKKSTEKDIAEAIELLMIAARGKNTNAFKKLEKLAKEGNTQAKQNLAICYQYGFGTEVDQQAAISITATTISNRNEAINPSSQKVSELIKNIDLSFMHSSNCTLVFDLNKIEPITKKTYKTLIEERRLSTSQTPYIISLVNDARNGSFYDLDGQSTLIEMQGNGIHPLTRKKIRSIYLFTIDSLLEEFKYFNFLKQKSIRYQNTRIFLQTVIRYASGDSKELYEFALSKIEKRTKKEIAEAIELLMSAAKAMSTDAFKYLEKLGFEGNLRAALNTAICYQHGYGTEVDLPKAMNLFTLLAKENDTEAFHNILASVSRGDRITQAAIDFCLEREKAIPTSPEKSSKRKREKSTKEIEDVNVPKVHNPINTNEPNLTTTANIQDVFLRAKQGDSQAFKTLFELADKGNPVAQYYVGLCEEYGYGTPLSIENAVEWYIRSAKLDNPEALEALYRRLRTGDFWGQKSSQSCTKENAHLGNTNNNAQPDMNKIVENHFDKALQGDPNGFTDLGNLAIEDNNAHAQYFFGLCLQNGYSSTPSPENAIQFYRKAAKQGHSEAFDLLLGFAEKDFATAQNEVAFCKAKGLITPLDLKGAYSWILQSATSGNAQGQYTLGCYLEKGIGTEANIDDALMWYLKSAKAGDGAAFEALERLAKNKNVTALEYLSSSKDLGRQSEDNQPSIFDQINQYGKIGNPANFGPLSINELEMNKAILGDKEAFKVLLNRAEKGNPRAQFYVGICYEKAYGTAFSLENAMQWYAKSAELEYSDALKHLLLFADKGYAFAQNKAAYCKLKGLGCISDQKVALHLYLLSAKGGNAEGQYYYGYCLEKGFGIELNHDEAALWYANAAYQNHPEAFKALSRFAEKKHVKALEYVQQIQQKK